MALEVETLKQGPALNAETGYKLEEELYETADGRIVRAGTGEAESLYRRVGGVIPFELAVELGLHDEVPTGGGVVVEAREANIVQDATDQALVDLFIAAGKELAERGEGLQLDEAKAEEIYAVFAALAGEVKDGDGDAAHDDGGAAAADDLEGLKRPELLEKAKEAGVEGPEKVRKNVDLVKAIEEKRAEVAAEDEGSAE